MIPIQPHAIYTVLETKELEYDSGSPGLGASSAELTYWVDPDDHTKALPSTMWVFTRTIWELYHWIDTNANFGSLDATATRNWSLTAYLRILDESAATLHELSETVTIDQAFTRHSSLETVWNRTVGGDGLLYTGPINGIRYVATWSPANSGGGSPANDLDFNSAVYPPVYPWRCKLPS